MSAGRWRDSHQATDWVGKAIGQALHLDPADPKDKRRILSMLKTWKANGMFVVVEGKDSKGMPRSFVELGEWATD